MPLHIDGGETAAVASEYVSHHFEGPDNAILGEEFRQTIFRGRFGEAANKESDQWIVPWVEGGRVDELSRSRRQEAAKAATSGPRGSRGQECVTKGLHCPLEDLSGPQLL
jgi:hypothetical protein